MKNLNKDQSDLNLDCVLNEPRFVLNELNLCKMNIKIFFHILKQQLQPAPVKQNHPLHNCSYAG